MHTTRLATVIATAIGLALTTGCTGSGTNTARAPVATTSAATTPALIAAPASPTPVRVDATAAVRQPTSGTSTVSAGAAPVTHASSEPVLTWTGLAGVRLGSKAAVFAAALGHELVARWAPDPQVPAELRCSYRGLSGMPGLDLMVIGADAEGPVQVISLTPGSRIQTSAGIGLGDSIDEVRRAYGPYLLDQGFDFWPEDGHALTAQATDSARWVFIADNRNQLVEIRLGRTPEVYYPEGCA
jgi:hypothetical protein